MTGVVKKNILRLEVTVITRQLTDDSEVMAETYRYTTLKPCKCSKAHKSSAA